jgi:hypothetical protein
MTRLSSEAWTTLQVQVSDDLESFREWNAANEPSATVTNPIRE